MGIKNKKHIGLFHIAVILLNMMINSYLIEVKVSYKGFTMNRTHLYLAVWVAHVYRHHQISEK